MANVPITGGAELGNVLADIGRNIATTARQDQLLAQQRAHQLEDVKSQRDYADRVRREERTGRLEDETASAILRQGIAFKGALINEGLLSPAQANDPAAVQAAWEEMQRRGLDKLYQELLSTPGQDGKPLLTQEELMNPAAVAAAKNALGQIKAQQLQFQREQPKNAQESMGDIQRQLATIRAQKEATTARANEPAPQFSPNDPKVLALAAQMAEQNKPGSGRNREAVMAMVPLALKQLSDQALLAWGQTTQSAKIELESLRRSEAELTGTLERMMGTFKVAPPRMAPDTSLRPAQASSSAPKEATAAEIAAAVNQVPGGGKPDPSAPSAPDLFENPTNNPTIAAGNEAIIKQRQATLNDLDQKIGAIDTALSNAASRGAKGTPLAFGGMGPADTSSRTIMLAPNPIGAARDTTALLKQKAALEKQRREMQAILQGPVVGAATPSVINTPTSSTPTWWQSQTPPDDR